MGLRDRLSAAARLGAGELRGAYQDRKARIRLKAQHKRAQAKTKIQRAKIKYEEAKEMADLEAEMYNAKIAMQNAQRRAKELRHQAGSYTAAERFSGIVEGAAGMGYHFARGFAHPKGRRPTGRRAGSERAGRSARRAAEVSVRAVKKFLTEPEKKSKKKAKRRR